MMPCAERTTVWPLKRGLGGGPATFKLPSSPPSISAWTGPLEDQGPIAVSVGTSYWTGLPMMPSGGADYCMAAQAEVGFLGPLDGVISCDYHSRLGILFPFPPT